jgi:hypothetical protein
VHGESMRARASVYVRMVAEVHTRIKAVLSDDEGMGQKAYSSTVTRRVSCQDARVKIARKCALFRTEFTACVLCSFAI